MLSLKYPGWLAISGFVAMIVYLFASGIYIKRHHASECVKLAVIPVFVVFSIVIFAGLFRQNFIQDNADYVVTRHEYTVSNMRKRNTKHRLDCDSQRLRRLPCLKFRNPKVGNIKLSQFEKFNNEHHRLQRVVKADRHSYYLATHNTPAQAVTTKTDVHNAEHDIKKDGNYIFVRHTKLRRRALPYCEHEFRCHPKQVEEEV